MAGGVVAGVVGPRLVIHTMDLWAPHLFAATFLAQAAVAAVSAIVLLGVRLPMPSAAEIAGGRPLAAIARQPRFVIAVICGVVSHRPTGLLMRRTRWFRRRALTAAAAPESLHSADAKGAPC